MVDGRTLKSLVGWSVQFGYAVFVRGGSGGKADLQSGRRSLSMASKSYYEEKYDKATFIKNIITDNIMLGDIYIRARSSIWPPGAAGRVLVRPIGPSTCP